MYPHLARLGSKCMAMIFQIKVTFSFFSMTECCKPESKLLDLSHKITPTAYSKHKRATKTRSVDTM